MTEQKFSLVTTCFNEIDSLPNWQADVEAQTRYPDEIIIVDSLSTDGTREMLQEWAAKDSRVRIKCKKCSAARGRNIAIHISSYDIVVSTDMGIRIDPEWFENIVSPFEDDSTIEIVAGSYSVDNASVISSAARAEQFIVGDISPFMLGTDSVLKLKPEVIPSNRSSAYKKSVWLQLGGLPEDLTLYSDDSVFGRQMLKGGYKIALAPNAIVFWQRPLKLKDFWKEANNYGRGRGEAMLNPPIAFRMLQKKVLPRSLVPIVTGLRLITERNMWNGLWRSIKKLDIIAAFYIPILLFGKGYHFGKGFLIGDDHGKIHCLDCRARLSDNTFMNDVD